MNGKREKSSDKMKLDFPGLFKITCLVFFLQLSMYAVGGSYAYNNEKINPGDDKLNILLITTDDQGIQVGCYGDSLALTPNIDKLSEQGIMFTNAYVTHASCSPSRSSIVSGLYPHQNGQIGLSGAHPEYRIHETVKLLPNILKEAGYYTGIIGKLHMSPRDIFHFDYDKSRINTPETRRDVAYYADLSDTFFSEKGAEPFFLYINYFDPHRPYGENAMQFKGLPEEPYGPDDIEPFKYLGIDGSPVREEVAGYYNCVNRMDAGIGLLLDQLKKHQLYDNTLIIFIGDHGVPFTRAKTTCYEAGTKIPFIVRWPGLEAEERIIPEFVSTVDIMPTILDAIGIPSPVDVGISLRSLIEGNNVGWRDFLFTEYTSHGAKHFYPRRAVRGKKYKLIHNLDSFRENPVVFIGTTRLNPGVTVHPLVKDAYKIQKQPPEWELYDLQDDPFEINNLAENQKYVTILNELKEELMEWRISTDDPLLDPKELTRLRNAHDL